MTPAAIGCTVVATAVLPRGETVVAVAKSPAGMLATMIAADPTQVTRACTPNMISYRIGKSGWVTEPDLRTIRKITLLSIDRICPFADVGAGLMGQLHRTFSLTAPLISGSSASLKSTGGKQCSS